MLVLHFDLPVDYGTSTFFLWNFAVVGVRVVFWPAPQFIKQSYLVVVSVLLAWSLTKLPEWTTWSVLAAVSVWDLVAVLTPRGPLKALVEESQRRNEPIPGLIYEGEREPTADAVFPCYEKGGAGRRRHAAWTTARSRAARATPALWAGDRACAIISPSPTLRSRPTDPRRVPLRALQPTTSSWDWATSCFTAC
jgi:hypothetical protein